MYVCQLGDSPEQSKGWSNSFPETRNSYRVETFSSLWFQLFTDGIAVALTKADEVARNGVLQRITSARGFL